MTEHKTEEPLCIICHSQPKDPRYKCCAICYEGIYACPECGSKSARHITADDEGPCREGRPYWEYSRG